MFVRVKKIGPYEYLYLVENAAKAAAMYNASSRRSASTMRRELRPARWPDRLRRLPLPPFHRAVPLLRRRAGRTAPPPHRRRPGVRPTPGADRLPRGAATSFTPRSSPGVALSPPLIARATA